MGKMQTPTIKPAYHVKTMRFSRTNKKTTFFCCKILLPSLIPKLNHTQKPLKYPEKIVKIIIIIAYSQDFIKLHLQLKSHYQPTYISY